ncbi:MAG: hypothetical protein JWR37_3048 [Mycobacterium sp.]|nr:hypothetical protein [Mycobacterium sp.]
MAVLCCYVQVAAQRVGLRHLLGRKDFHLGDELTQTWFGVLADVAIQPGGHSGDQIVAEWDSFPGDGGDQVVNRREHIADADGDVDAVIFTSREVWASC